MNFVWMLLAFLVMLGIALAFHNILKVNIGESMLLCASAIVLTLFLSGLAGSFTFGMYGLFAVSVLGYLLMIRGVIREGAVRLSLLCSPCPVILFLFFLYCLIAYYNDFIQHIDEFHQWAYAVKYMLETNLLPNHSVLVGNQNPYATGLFYLFFQRITGYSEQNMYVASSLLIWIGLMLPFSEYERKDWKKVALYSLIMYFGLYSLYTYGVKNLYVDLPVIAWAGGLAGWWMNRTRKRANVLILAAGVLMIGYFKWKAGPLMALFVLLFAVVHTLFIERRILEDDRRRRAVIRVFLTAVAALTVLAVLAGLILLKAPNTMQVISELLRTEITKDKAVRTIGAFLTVAVGKPLAARSELKIAFVPFLVLIFMLFKLTSELFHQEREFRVYLFYTVGTAGLFGAVLLYAYLSLFSYEESVKMSGGIRYLSLYAVYIFIIALVWLLQRKRAVCTKMPGYIAAGLLLLFLYGVNQSFIPSMTGLNSYDVKGFGQISKAKRQIASMQQVFTDQDRVYMVDQKGENEYAKNVAFYYLGEQVSNYNHEAWKFTEDGSIIRWAEHENPSIEDLPALLEEGEYTYLWVYRADDYLKEEMPKVLDCQGKIGNGRLYRIIYEDGEAVGIQIEKKL